MANITADVASLSHAHRRRLRTKTIIFLLLMALLGPMSNILFRAGMEHVGVLSSYRPAALLIYGWRMLTNGFLVVGTLMRILFTLISFLVLTWADYSFVTPASAVNYAIVAILGCLLLGESVSPERWIGIGFICLGVALVGSTPASTTAAEIPAGNQIMKRAHSTVSQGERELC